MNNDEESQMDAKKIMDDVLEDLRTGGRAAKDYARTYKRGFGDGAASAFTGMLDFMRQGITVEDAVEMVNMFEDDVNAWKRGEQDDPDFMVSVYLRRLEEKRNKDGES